MLRLWLRDIHQEFIKAEKEGDEYRTLPVSTNFDFNDLMIEDNSDYKLSEIVNFEILNDCLLSNDVIISMKI